MLNLELTIDRIENDKAVLKTKDNETIIWPKSKLPLDAKDGSVFYFLIKNAEEKEQAEHELAKNILNEILSGEEEKEE